MHPETHVSLAQIHIAELTEQVHCEIEAIASRNPSAARIAAGRWMMRAGARLAAPPRSRRMAV